jgi:hypothetical protein
MSGILYELEEAIVLFVKERVPSHKWKYLTHRFAIVGLMEDDDVDELKEHFFAELMNAVKWSSVVNEIAEMTENKEEQEELWDDDING